MKNNFKKVKGNPNAPGILLSGPQTPPHPSNVLPGSHQHPEVAELGREKSHEVCISPTPQIEMLPADLLHMAPLSVQSQRGTCRRTRAQTGASSMRRTCSALLWGLQFPTSMLVRKHRRPTTNPKAVSPNIGSL